MLAGMVGKFCIIGCARSNRNRGTELSDAARFLGQTIDGTPFHAAALYLLSKVPGGPPIVQTVHLLGISVVMGSAVLINLRVLGLALRGQATEDLIRRLAPWTWTALPLLALSGLVFIVAQPYRYLDDPIFRLKFALMVPAIATTIARHRRPDARGRLAVASRRHSGSSPVGRRRAGRPVDRVCRLPHARWSEDAAG